MSWKELAIGLADDKGAAIHCPFRGCMREVTERWIEWLGGIQKKRREERVASGGAY